VIILEQYFLKLGVHTLFQYVFWGINILIEKLYNAIEHYNAHFVDTFIHIKAGSKVIWNFILR